jgi:hypothetical protein
MIDDATFFLVRKKRLPTRKGRLHGSKTISVIG